MVTRDAGWGVLNRVPGPILVTVRTTDLSEVLPKIPPARIEDLVLIQNGMLTPWLKARGYDKVSRGVLYFAVPKRGAPIEVGDASPFCGGRAGEVVEWLESLGLGARETGSEAFKAIEVEKLLWNCVFGLMCGLSGETVGHLCDASLPVIREMTAELIAVASASRGVTLDHDRVVRSMVAYSQSIAGYVGRVSDWEFRNGWFVQAAEKAGVPTPVHSEWVSGWSERS